MYKYIHNIIDIDLFVARKLVNVKKPIYLSFQMSYLLILRKNIEYYWYFGLFLAARTRGIPRTVPCRQAHRASAGLTSRGQTASQYGLGYTYESYITRIYSVCICIYTHINVHMFIYIYTRI